MLSTPLSDGDAARHGLDPADVCARCRIGLIRAHGLYQCWWRGQPWRQHHARGLCASCYILTGRYGTRLDYARATSPTALLMEEWRWVCPTLPVPAAAVRLGVSSRVLYAALHRHRRGVGGEVA